ncbi:MAG TPA: protein-disulfide reductase DsbD [Gammaproteobacteria bacterium]|nr:protein-disulfide reductase DsbD [Gammaproteobacteria bacterium]
MKPEINFTFQGRLKPAAWLAVLCLLLSGAAQAFLSEEDDLLDAEVAFSASGSSRGDTVLVHYNIAEGYYLYRHAFKFTPVTQGVTLGEPVIPAGEKHIDEDFGEVETYRNSLDIQIPFSYVGQVRPTIIELQATSRGCADRGVCYPPHMQALAVGIDAATSTAVTGPDAAGASTVAAPAVSEQDRFAAILMQGVSVTLLTFFGVGLLLAFTPCVFPMIPILSGIIVGQGKPVTTGRAFILSVVYVLAMACTYTAVGVIAGLSGKNIQVLFQSPWVLSTFAAVFVALSLAMFGFYELQMPSAIQSKLSSLSNSQQGGSLVGVAVMGLLSALIVGPCVTAPLIGALIYIAKTGDAVLGGVALFALSLGMGAPLIVIGTSAGKLMPKAGPWMDAVKNLFGVLLLGVAIWLLSRVLPAGVSMALYAALAIGSGVYMGALDRESRDNWRKLWKAVGLILFIYGAALFVGALAGNQSMLQPLQGIVNGATNTADKSHLAFRRIKGVAGLQQALDEAKRNQQPVMLDFYADWCVSCKEMEALTFTDPQVRQLLSSFLLIQADVTANEEEDQALLKKLELVGPPAIIFYDVNGREIPGQRVVGFMKSQDFAAHLQQLKQSQ